MSAGRPPKPTQLKLLHGDDKKNPGRINTAEPVPAATDVAPPFELTDAAQAIWDRLAPDRIDKKVLTAWDVDAFGLFCEALAITQSKVRPAHRPWKPRPGTASPLSELKTAIGVVSQLGARFGWTPSDRARLVSGEAGGDADDDLLTG